MGVDNLIKLAQTTTEALAKRIGVDGAIVILFRKDGDAFAGSISAPTIPFDGVFGGAIKALSAMRDDALRQIADKGTKDV